LGTARSAATQRGGVGNYYKAMTEARAHTAQGMGTRNRGLRAAAGLPSPWDPREVVGWLT